MLGVLDVNGLDAVERDHHVRPLGADLVRVPFAGGLDRCCHFSDIDDRARRVRGIRPRVVDVDFVAVGAARHLRLLAADEDAAVGRLVYPELRLDLEVAVRLLGDEISAHAFVGLDSAVGNPPVCVAYLVERVEILSVEQRCPLALRGGEERHRRQGHRHDELLHTASYLRALATDASAAFAHFSSASCVGEPLMPSAPIVSLPTLIGTPPPSGMISTRKR